MLRSQSVSHWQGLPMIGLGSDKNQFHGILWNSPGRCCPSALLCPREDCPATCPQVITTTWTNIHTKKYINTHTKKYTNTHQIHSHTCNQIHSHTQNQIHRHTITTNYTINDLFSLWPHLEHRQLVLTEEQPPPQPERWDNIRDPKNNTNATNIVWNNSFMMIRITSIKHFVFSVVRTCISATRSGNVQAKNNSASLRCNFY